MPYCRRLFALSLALCLLMLFALPARADVVPPHTEHTYGNWTEAPAATCTAAGRKQRVCTQCSDIEYEVLPALGHNYGDWVAGQPAGCLYGGTTQRICKRCADTQVQSTKALGHDWGAWGVVTNADCFTAGLTRRLCARCGAMETESSPALGHAWSEFSDVSLPTCDLPGLRVRTCTRCSTQNKLVLPALLHTWGGYNVTVVATCISQGWAERACSRCGDRQGYALNRLAHPWGEWTVFTAPACGTKGEERRACAMCHEVQKRSIKALKHVSNGVWAITRTATLSRRGEQATACTLCGKTADTRGYAPRGYRYDVPAYGFGAPAGDVSPALANLPTRLIYVDMRQEGTFPYPLVTQDDYVIGEVRVHVSGGTLGVTLHSASEPTRLREMRWHLYEEPSAVTAAQTRADGYATSHVAIVSGPACAIDVQAMANYYQGNENRPFSPDMAALWGEGTVAEQMLSMLRHMLGGQTAN